MSENTKRPGQPRLLDRLRAKIRLMHYSIRTEEAYADWVRRFILFHNKRHPKEMGAAEIEAFLSHLAVEGRSQPARKTRRSRPFCSFIPRCWTSNFPGSTPCGRRGPNASRPSSRPTKCDPC